MADWYALTRPLRPEQGASKIAWVTTAARLVSSLAARTSSIGLPAVWLGSPSSEKPHYGIFGSD